MLRNVSVPASTVITRDVSATPSIDAVFSDMGANHLIWEPSDDTNRTYKAPRGSKITIDLTNGDVQSPAHGVAFYAYAVYQGTGTSDLGYGVESKLELKDAGTNVVSHSMFKPALGPVNGTLSLLKMFDGEMDLSGINGTISKVNLIYSPDKDKLAFIKGGVLTNSKVVTDSHTLTENDSGTTLVVYSSSAATVTVPIDLPYGFHCRIVQAGTGKVTVAAEAGDGAYTILNADGHASTSGAWRTIEIVTALILTTKTVFLFGQTGA